MQRIKLGLGSCLSRMSQSSPSVCEGGFVGDVTSVNSLFEREENLM